MLQFIFKQRNSRFCRFFLAITALVYYLDSFSRKSVYFICFAMALIISDVLRDMVIFCFKDLSVELVAALMKSAALVFSFLFVLTRERKLRLLNLVWKFLFLKLSGVF